jgi:hypothetical protein
MLRAVRGLLLVERRHQEAHVQQGGVDQFYRAEHVLEIVDHFGIPRSGQKRDDRPALFSLFGNERGVELGPRQIVEVGMNPSGPLGTSRPAGANAG